MKNFFYLSFLFLLAILSCTRNDAQREFERQAYQEASGYTETTNEGQVESVDENDWRISPLFQGLIEISPPYPNPAPSSSVINFEVDVTGVQSVSGLELVVRYPNGEFNTIYFNQESLPPGLTTFQISASELGFNQSVESRLGLHRVYFFDGNQQMISYGDIMVE